MGLQVYGILSTESPDSAGEIVKLDGIDISQLKTIKDEHPDQDNFFHTVGGISRAKKIYKKIDCEDYKQNKCWDLVKQPFLYIEGELADDQEGHMNARATAAMMKFCQQNDVPLDVGWSIDGGTIERQNESGQTVTTKDQGSVLARTLALAGSLTVKPCHPQCKAFIDEDLKKSLLNSRYKIAPPAKYSELLKKSRKQSSIVNSEQHIIDPEKVKLLVGLSKLQKSLEDYNKAFTEMSCYHCNEPVRFFKNTDQLPSVCKKCNRPYSMQAIWKALNR